jgi:hypothetical protein
MEDTATIRLDSDIVLEPSLGTLQKWLPAIHHNLTQSQRFNAGYMISSMEKILANRLSYTITSDTIVTILDELLKYMKPTPFAAISVGTRLYQNMEGCLRADLNIATTSDLRRSRHRFLMFCLLAQLTRSQALARSMAGFLQHFVWEIVYSEEPELLKEWGMGIIALHGLALHQTLEELFRCFFGFSGRGYKPRLQPTYYDPRVEMIRFMMLAQQHPLFHHQQRRAPLMLEGPAGYLRDRSLSVGHPRQHHRRHPQLQIAYPWAQANRYYDEVGKLQYQQEKMNVKLDHIDRKLDYLF